MTQGLKRAGGALAVAAAISLWVDLPKDPYVPKVIARNPMSSPLSSMILAARRSLDDAYALAAAPRTSLDKDDTEESMVGWVMPTSNTVAPSSKRPYVVRSPLRWSLSSGSFARRNSEVVD